MTLYDYVGRHTPLNVSIVGFMRHSCVGHDALAWPVRLMKLARGSVVECCSDVTFDVISRVMFSLSVLGAIGVSSSALLCVSSSWHYSRGVVLADVTTSATAAVTSPGPF